MPFSLVHKFAEIGDHSILNTHSTVDHECVVGKGVHIMGSAAVAGNVTIGDFVTVGTNATILSGLNIGEGAYVGAGAVVTKDVKPYTVVAGLPARLVRMNRLVFRRRRPEGPCFLAQGDRVCRELRVFAVPGSRLGTTAFRWAIPDPSGMNTCSRMSQVVATA